ncbi:MAG: MOSC domain-containing protein [Actinomycetota bacterium]
MPRVARIGVTPVKGMALVHPDRVDLTEAGVPLDRDLYLVDDSGRMVTASEFGPLQTIQPSYDPSANCLSLTFPDGRVVEDDASRTAEPLLTDFYGRPVPAHVVEGPWASTLSRFVGVRVRLARCDRPGDGTDVHHVTMMSRASAAEVARRGDHAGELDARRFRMTFELDGCAPHEEDTWTGRSVRFGDAELRIHGPVPRCVVTTQDPATGRKDFDTLKVIASYRELMREERGIPFGVYAEVERPGRVGVGDPVEVLDRLDPPVPAMRDQGREASS